MAVFLNGLADRWQEVDRIVPLDRAGAAIDTAEQFVNEVTELLT